MSTHVPDRLAVKTLLDAEALGRTLSRIAHEIIERNDDLTTVALIGIHTRGVPIAERLAALIEERSGEEVGLGAVDLLELDLNPFAAGGGQVLADVVGADRQLAVAAVDQDGELDARRATALEERLDCGADRAAGVEDVVDEDAGHPREVEVEGGRVHDGLNLAGDGVVAVERDVDGAEPDLLPAPLLDQGGEPLRDRDAAGVDADQGDLGQVGVALDDLVGDPREGARESLCVQQRLHRKAVGAVRAHSSVHSHSFPASLDRVKGVGRILARPADAVARGASRARR
jgi:pyrimidine operon attenuation protein/uracil phosphoribosyltransferase